MDLKALNEVLGNLSETAEIEVDSKVQDLLQEYDKTEKSEFVAPFFAGFYESLYCEDATAENLFNDANRVPDEIVDWAVEHAEDVDWEGYKNDVGELYIQKLEEEIQKVIPNFRAEFEEIESPASYNYVTDKCIGLCNFNEVREDIKKYIEEHKEAFAEYVKNKYTSYDGFWSNYSNDINSPEWDLDKDLDYNEIGTILGVILTEEMDNVQDLNYRTWEDSYEGFTFDFEEMKKNFKFNVEPKTEEDLYYYVKEGDTYVWHKDSPGQLKLDLDKTLTAESLLEQFEESVKTATFTRDNYSGDLTIYTDNFRSIVATVSDCAGMSDAELDELADEVLEEHGYIKGNYFTAATDEEAESNVIEQKREMLKIKFVGVDDWGRPTFKPVDSSKKYYLCDLDNLFHDGTTAEEVKEFYADMSLPLRNYILYKGNSFDSEPMGSASKYDLEIV